MPKTRKTINFEKISSKICFIFQKNVHNKNINTKRRNFFMQEKQKINCTVDSCEYNNRQENECILKQIIVTPCQNCHTGKPDESMCSSYKYNQKNH